MMKLTNEYVENITREELDKFSEEDFNAVIEHPHFNPDDDPELYCNGEEED